MQECTAGMVMIIIKQLHLNIQSSSQTHSTVDSAPPTHTHTCADIRGGRDAPPPELFLQVKPTSLSAPRQKTELGFVSYPD